ncbi:MAG TPA: hypothetical protein VGM17_16550 [Rhizomicrobium sp.]|jgi:hypothetical protein
MGAGTKYGLVILGSLMLSGVALAAPDYPAGAEHLEQALLAKVDSTWQAWIKQETRNSVSAGMLSEDRARGLAERARQGTGLDLDTLSFLISMQMARDANADLEAVMSHSREQWEDSQERSSMAHNKPPSATALSSGTQQMLSNQPHTIPVMRSNPSPLLQTTPTADIDDAMHLDLQTAMDREAEAEDTLKAAFAKAPKTARAP